MFDPPGMVAFNKIPFSEETTLPRTGEMALQAARRIDRAIEKTRMARCPLKPMSKRWRWSVPNADPWRRLEGITKARHPIRSTPWRNPSGIRRQDEDYLCAGVALRGQFAAAGAFQRLFTWRALSLARD